MRHTRRWPLPRCDRSRGRFGRSGRSNRSPFIIGWADWESARPASLSPLLRHTASRPSRRVRTPLSASSRSFPSGRRRSHPTGQPGSAWAPEVQCSPARESILHRRKILRFADSVTTAPSAPRSGALAATLCGGLRPGSLRVHDPCKEGGHGSRLGFPGRRRPRGPPPLPPMSLGACRRCCRAAPSLRSRCCEAAGAQWAPRAGLNCSIKGARPGWDTEKGGRRPRPGAGGETEDTRRFVGRRRGAGSALSAAKDQGRRQRRFRQLSTAGRSRPRDRSRGHVVRSSPLRPLEPPSLLPLAAQTLALLGREVPELLEAFPECLAPFGWQLAPAPEASPEAFLFLRRQLLPPAVVLSDPLLLIGRQPSKGVEPIPHGLLLLRRHGLPSLAERSQALPLFGRQVLPPPAEVLLPGRRLGGPRRSGPAPGGG